MTAGDVPGTFSAAPPGIRDHQTEAALRDLSPTARRILEAAHRVLARHGYAALSLRRVAEEAGVSKALVVYHFEGKAGLVTSLVDSLWHDDDVALAEEVERLAEDRAARLRALVNLHRRLALRESLYRTWLDLLPHVLRDPESRARLARTYAAYREIGQRCLLQGSPGLATVLLATGEGLGVDVVVTGDQATVGHAFAVLERRVGQRLGLGGAASLNPAQRQVLDAALHLLPTGGVAALTAESLARRSGVPVSSVFYRFGDKKGLLTTVLRAVQHRLASELRAAVSPRLTRPASSGRTADALGAVVEVQAALLRDPDWARAFYELLPTVIRDDDLRRLQADFVHRLRDAVAALLADGGVPAADAAPLAAAALALTYGLAAQRLVDLDGAPTAAALAAWRELLRLP